MHKINKARHARRSTVAWNRNAHQNSWYGGFSGTRGGHVRRAFPLDFLPHSLGDLRKFVKGNRKKEQDRFCTLLFVGEGKEGKGALFFLIVR